MSLLQQITAASWTVVASQVFNDGHDTSWDWKCDHREAGEIFGRIHDGRLISGTRKVAPGVYDLLVRIPKNAPQLKQTAARAESGVAVRQPARPAPEAPQRPALANAPKSRKPCCFHFGQPGKLDFYFCGAPSLAGLAYCAEHLWSKKSVESP